MEVGVREEWHGVGEQPRGKEGEGSFPGVIHKGRK